MSSKKLNAEQKKAVEHDQGPLLVIAGAGTGKTTVVTERVCRLIAKCNVSPNEILALTFTEKAAREMEERVDIALPYGYTNMWIMTFHSFCDQILHQEALHIGLEPRFQLMSEAESIQFIRQRIFDFELDYFRPRGNPNKFIAAMLTHFSRLADEDVDVEKYLAYAKSLPRALESQQFAAQQTLELAQAYKTYAELKASEGVMDFGDLITKALELFRTRPNVLANYQKQFRYLLVDEFQDVNFAQYQLAKILAGEKANIMATGDDDQSIYRFRGAAVSNILQFRKDYPQSQMAILTKNYRSTQTILEAAYKLICFNNPDRLEAVENFDKKLVAKTKGQGDPVQFIHAQKAENEAEFVGREIEKLVENGFDYGDIAILVRANNHAESFMHALARLGIPHQFLGPGKLFKEPEIINLVAYLKVLDSLEDTISLYRVLTMEHLAITERDLALILGFSKKYNLSLFEACENVGELKVSTKTKDKIKTIIALINSHLKAMKTETAGQILYDFLDKTGYIKALLSPEPSLQKSAENISRLFDKLKNYEVEHQDASVAAVVGWIDLASELGESPLAAGEDWTQVNAVNILTIHAAKGLEFPVVFLVNLVSERFPSRARAELIPIPTALIVETLPLGDYHLQEERRLFYVGMTRAQDRLYFTASDYYGEAKRKKKLSQFIFEALGPDALSQESKVSEQLNLMAYANSHKQRKNQGVVLAHQVHYLSFSQIDAFQTCPLHYKLRHILNIPTPPSAALSFGSSLHAAMKDFYASVKAGVRPSKKLILDSLEGNWIKLGYQNKRHGENAYKGAEKLLTDYYKKHFRPDRLPLLLEHHFMIPLERKEGKKTIYLKVGGAMDRVDETGGGIEIIDYKTGEKVPTRAEVDKNMQLTLYALAATKLKEPPFVGLKPEQIKLSLFYFEEQKKITTMRTQAQLTELECELFSIKARIEASDFACSGHFYCQNNCEYAIFCKEDLLRAK